MHGEVPPQVHHRGPDRVRDGQVRVIEHVLLSALRVISPGERLDHVQRDNLFAIHAIMVRSVHRRSRALSLLVDYFLCFAEFCNPNSRLGISDLFGERASRLEDVARRRWASGWGRT